MSWSQATDQSQLGALLSSTHGST